MAAAVIHAGLLASLAARHLRPGVAFGAAALRHQHLGAAGLGLSMGTDVGTAGPLRLFAASLLHGGDRLPQLTLLLGLLPPPSAPQTAILVSFCHDGFLLSRVWITALKISHFKY